MNSNVTRLKPRPSSYEEALEAFGSGDFSSCVDFLSNSLSAESVILRARALIRLGDAGTAVESLCAYDFGDASHELAAEALALQCYAFHVLRRPSDAAALGVEARARCFSSGLVGIEAELIFASALASLRDGKIDEAEAAAACILDLVDESPSWVVPKTYAYSLDFWRARACDVRGMVESLRANYVGLAIWLRKAIGEFDKSGVRDDYTHVLFLANYADAAITLGHQEIIEFVAQRAEQITWSPSLAIHEYRIFSALGEASSGAGDQLGALRYFRRCRDCAPNAALQIRAGVERGRLLHEMGEPFSAREEIDHALRLSRAFDWESATALQQRQLVFLAGEVAKFDGPQAQKILSRYDALDSNSNVGIAIKDDRFRGEEFMARAAVLAANGRNDRAIMLLIDALGTFTSAGLEAKAAYVAAELAELTNEPHYIEIARKQCVKQPHSILARKMARFSGLELEPEAAAAVLPMPPPTVLRTRPKLALLSN